MKQMPYILTNIIVLQLFVPLFYQQFYDEYGGLEKQNIKVVSTNPLVVNVNNDESKQVKVCSFYMPEDVSTLCRSQGFTKSYEGINDDMVYYNVTCPQVYEDGISFMCDYETAYMDSTLSDCGSYYDYCDDCLKVVCKNYRCDIQDADATTCTSCIGGTEGNDYDRTATNCECQNGKVDMYPVHERCQDEPADSNEDIRIYGNQKLIQVMHNYEWKYVCDSPQFDELAANTVCKQKGFNSFATYLTGQECITDDSVPIDPYMNSQFWMSDIVCTGNEQKLSNCFHNGFGMQYECGLYNCISIECIDFPDGDGDLRMNGGTDGNISIVEIIHQNQDNMESEWRPVCDVSLDSNMAHVLCKQQGFDTYKTFWNNQECPNGKDQTFWFGRLICTGSEDQLSGCRYPDGWINSSKQDCGCILLECQNDQPRINEGSVRIDSNFVEIYHEDRWGQVCGALDLGKLGKTVCKQLKKTNNNQDPKINTLTQINKQFAALSDSQKDSVPKKNLSCPDYKNYWIDDINCAGRESGLSNCELNKEWGKHKCDQNDCLFLNCDGELLSAFEYAEGDLKVSDNKKIIEIYHDSEWKPISDSGNEYDPSNGKYGAGINKPAAHVICKQLGFATFSKIEKNQECEDNFDDYWLGNIMCLGEETKLKDCFNMGWGKHTAGNDKKKCVKITCSESETCPGENKVKSIRYPYCSCANGYYDDGNSADCQKCSDKCSTCIFTASNCLVCAEATANYKILDYEKWYSINTISSGTRQLIAQQYLRQLQEEILCFEGCQSCSVVQICDQCIEQGKDPSNCCTEDIGISPPYTNMECWNSLCGDACAQCDVATRTCMMCKDMDMDMYNCCAVPVTDGITPGNYTCEYENNQNQGNSTDTGDQVQSGQDCYIYGSYCGQCNNEKCTQCVNTNYELIDNYCMLRSFHTAEAPCAHISDGCKECKGDICTKCFDGNILEYNCPADQTKQECSDYGEKCYFCEQGYGCFQCQLNYLVGMDQKCEDVPVGCGLIHEHCLECENDKCTVCLGILDPVFDCNSEIDIKVLCEVSGCDNCNGHLCVEEEYVKENQEDAIAEYESYTQFLLEDLNYENNVKIMFVDPQGVMQTQNSDFIESWQTFTCSLYCGEGYFDDGTGNCQKCEDQCLRCEDKKDNCKVCRYKEGNDYVSDPPHCRCLKGSKEDDTTGDCIQCTAGFYNFDDNSQLCTKCPDNASCNGGYEMDLKQGYWRLNSDSSEIVWCNNEESNCLGGTNPNVKNQCLEGHKGALCEACDLEGEIYGESYANSSEFDCAPCSKVENNVMKIIAINVFQFLGMYLSVGGTIIAVQDKIKFRSLKALFNTHEPTPDEQGVLMKILNNYFYIVGVLGTFQLQLPKTLKNANIFVSNPTKTMSYSFDCFLYSLQSTIPNIYFKVIWQIIIGGIQLLCVFGILLVLKMTRKTKIPTRTFVYTTIIYQFISMQPGIVTMILESVACRTIGDYRYILGNSSLKCEGSQYWAYTFSLMVPILLVVGGLIPFILYYGLKRASQSDQDKLRILNQNKIMPIQQIQDFEYDPKQEQHKALSQRSLNENNKEIQQLVKQDSGSTRNLMGNNSPNNFPVQQQQNKNDNSILVSEQINNFEQKKQAEFEEIIDDLQKEQTNNNIDHSKSQIQTDNQFKNIEDQLQSDKQSNIPDQEQQLKQSDQQQQQQTQQISDHKSNQSININIRSQNLQKDGKQVQSTAEQYENQKQDKSEDIQEVEKARAIQNAGQAESQLDKSVALSKFGFLYLEYKTNVFWWEFVKVYQRIAIAAVLAFYYNDIKVKGILVFLIVFFYVILSIRYKPYRRESHNRIDIISSVVTGVTLILGLFIYDNQYDEWIYIAGILVAIMNIYFLCLMISRILQSKTRQILLKTTQKIETKEQISQFEEIQKKKKGIFEQLKVIQKQRKDTVDLKQMEQLDEQIENKQQELQTLNDIIDSLDLLPQQYIEQAEIEERKLLEVEADQQQDETQLQKKQSIVIQKQKENNKNIKGLKAYITFQQNSEKQTNANAVSFFLQLVINAATFITSKFVGQTNQSSVKEAKFLKTILKEYFNKLLLKGIQTNTIIRSTQIELSQKQQQAQFNSLQILKGQLTEKQQSIILLKIDSIYQKQVKLNQQVLDKVANNYAKVLKDNNYPEKYFQDKINSDQEINQVVVVEQENSDKNDDSFENDESIQKQRVEELSKALSKTEILQEYEAFKLFDIKNQGFLTLEIIRNIMHGLGQQLSKLELNQMIQQIDADGNNAIDFCEYLALIANNKDKKLPVDELREIFHFYSEGANGQINFLDLDNILRSIFKIKASKQVLQEIIRSVDENNDGLLEFDEFKKLII